MSFVWITCAAGRPARAQKLGTYVRTYEEPPALGDVPRAKQPVISRGLSRCLRWIGLAVCTSNRPTAADRKSWRYRAWPEATNEANDILVLELLEDCDLGVESVVENLHSMPGTALLVHQEPDLHECAAQRHATYVSH